MQLTKHRIELARLAKEWHLSDRQKEELLKAMLKAESDSSAKGEPSDPQYTCERSAIFWLNPSGVVDGDPRILKVRIH